MCTYLRIMGQNGLEDEANLATLGLEQVAVPNLFKANSAAEPSENSFITKLRYRATSLPKSSKVFLPLLDMTTLKLLQACRCSCCGDLPVFMKCKANELRFSFASSERHHALNFVPFPGFFSSISSSGVSSALR